MAFTINNKTGSSIGPIVGQTIAANGTLVVANPDAIFATDTNLISYITSRIATLTVLGIEYSDNAALLFLVSRSVNTASSTPSTSIPSHGTLVGGSDGTFLRSMKVDSSGRVHEIINDGSGNPITSTLINSKQRLDVNNASDGTNASAVPFQTQLVGGSDGANLRSIKTDTSGNQLVVGNVASAAADSGNPIKIGSSYNSTPPLVTTGQRVDSQANENGELIVAQNYSSYTSSNKVWSVINLVTLTVGTSETAIMLFKNPNASGVKVRLIKILLTGASSFFIYSTPTITANGTSLTPTNNRIKTSPVAAVSTVFQSPTISANGTFMYWVSVSAQTGTFSLETTHLPIIDANNNILITAKAGSNNTPVSACLIFMETP